MRAFSISFVDAVSAFRDQLQLFVDTCAGIGDLELLDSSLCRGWSRLEVVVHVRMGLDEMAASATVRTNAVVTHDAASYWATHPDDRDDDPVGHILWMRRTASAYARPRGAVQHLTDAARRVSTLVDSALDGRVEFQSKVMTVGDFIATWAVELAVHQLDLDLAGSPPASRLARQTIEAIADADLPSAFSDAEAVKIGLGRVPWPHGSEQPGNFPVSL